MADIDRIVDVTITRATVTPSVASFGTIMIAAEFLAASATPTYGTDRVREYATLAEVATAFGTSHVVYYMAAKIFSQAVTVDSIKIGRKLTAGDGTETWTQALTAIAAEDNAWYGLAVGTRVEAEQQLVAAWVETAEKLCVLASNDADVVDGVGTIADYVDTQGYNRTGVIYHPTSDGTPATDPYPDCAWLGKVFPFDPGSITWAFKTLTSVASYYLTGAQITTATGKNANIYTEVASVDITQFGTVGSGEYFDVMMGLDWLKAQIQERIYTALINNAKIPFTDDGIQAVVGQLKAALQEAVELNILSASPAPTVSAPLASAVSATDKGNRLLPDVTFIATLAGAIHKTEINGTVSL